MKNLSKLGLLAGLALMVSFSAIDAKDCGSKGKKDCTEGQKDCKKGMKENKNKGEKLAKELNLTAEQKTKVDAIKKAQHEKAKVKKDAHKAEMKKLRDASDVEIRALLNDEQKAKFDKHLADKKARMEKKKGKKKNKNKNSKK